MLVEADAGQLEQVLLALAVNARDAMPDGGRLDLRTDNTELDSDYAVSYPEVTPGAYVRMTVSDTGHGIPEHIQDRIFEPFFSTRTSGDSSGLGLSAVQGIVAEAGGHITVYSEEGLGTAFKIHLPSTDRRGAGTSLQTSSPTRSSRWRFSSPRTIRTCGAWPSGSSRRPATPSAKRRTAPRRWRCSRPSPSDFELLLADVVMPTDVRPRPGRPRSRAPARPAGDLHVRLHAADDLGRPSCARAS